MAVGRGLRGFLVGALGVLLLAACVPGGEGPGPATYAALGDSFSSGDGAGAYDPEPADCKRSAFAWPRLLDAAVDLRACSGDEVAEVAEQVPGTPNTAVTLVTLTAGGNDAGFGDLFEACLLSACPSPTDPTFVADVAAFAAALGPLYTQLETAYPNARIVHVGYPRLTPPVGEDVSPACFWLSPQDQANAVALVGAINGAIAGAVAASPTDVEHLDVTDALADHELCTALPYITLLGRAHPTAPGQERLRAAVAAAL